MFGKKYLNVRAQDKCVTVCTNNDFYKRLVDNNNMYTEKDIFTG